jgi:phospholipid N-methyltransferase
MAYGALAVPRSISGPSSRRSADSQKTSPRSPDWWLFFTKFLQQGKAIASVAPSSPWLARALVRGIDFSQARCVVELGAGTGPITAELLRSVGPGCRLVIVERDADFCQRLRLRFPRADVVQSDAAELETLLDERRLAYVDHVISGLPLPSFPAGERDRLLEVVARKLTPGGTFRQLTHMPWVYYRLYRRYFSDVEFCFVPLNIPPGGYYICRGYRREDGPATASGIGA